MPIKVKVTPTNGEMPFYWMSLISYAYPGQFYFSNQEGSYIIFSGQGFDPQLTVAEIPNFLNRHQNVRSVSGFSCLEASLVDAIPAGAIPLYKSMWLNGIKRMTEVQGHSLAAAQQVRSWMIERCDRLQKQLTQQIKAGQAISDIDTFFQLEKTSNHLYRMANTVANGDIGRATHYTACVLFFDTRNELKDINAGVPQVEQGAVCHTFTLRNGRSLQELTDDAANFSTQLQNFCGLTSTIKITNEGGSAVASIIISDFPLEGRNDIFLERIRTAFYIAGLENRYDLAWKSSTVAPNPLLIEQRLPEASAPKSESPCSFWNVVAATAVATAAISAMAFSAGK